MGVTQIQWTDYTFNTHWVCTPVDEECRHCYAEAIAEKSGYKWGRTAPLRLFGDRHWDEPLGWDRAAKRAGTPRKVFCASMADVFEDRPELDAVRVRLFHLIQQTPNLIWQLLTKRPQNIHGMLPEWMFSDFPQNLWLGTSVGRNASIARAMALVSLPGIVHFVSAEPLLEALDLTPWLSVEQLNGPAQHCWVIVGGESGPNARGMALSWARQIVADCHQYRVPVFVKQLSSVYAKHATPRGLRHSHAGDPEEWPEDLRIRQSPALVEGRLL